MLMNWKYSLCENWLTKELLRCTFTFFSSQVRVLQSQITPLFQANYTEQVHHYPVANITHVYLPPSFSQECFGPRVTPEDAMVACALQGGRWNIQKWHIFIKRLFIPTSLFELVCSLESPQFFINNSKVIVYVVALSADKVLSNSLPQLCLNPDVLFYFTRYSTMSHKVETGTENQAGVFYILHLNKMFYHRWCEKGDDILRNILHPTPKGGKRYCF